MNSSGVSVPPASFSSAPSEWTGQREVNLADERNVLEFYAPFLIEGEYKGTVRIGLYKPELGASLEQLPFIASMALPVFLLAPMFYFLMRRQLQPLQETAGANSGTLTIRGHAEP